MNMEQLEFRLQENEGVINGLMQAVAFLASLSKSNPAYREAADKFVSDIAIVNINSTLPDFALEQSTAVLRTLLLSSE